MENTDYSKDYKWLNTYKLRDDWDDMKTKVKEVWDKYDDDWNESEYQFRKVLENYVKKIVNENLDSETLRILDELRIKLFNKTKRVFKNRGIPTNNNLTMFGFENQLQNKLYSSLYWGYLIKINNDKYRM